MRILLASDFGIWPANENVMALSDRMLASQYHRAQLANYLFLYDQIAIPTGNLQVLPVLRLILGEDVLDELIRSKVIVFVRFDHWIGYGGNGSGVLILQVSGPEGSGMNFATAHFEPLDVAIDTILTGTLPTSTASRKSELTNLLLDNVVSLPTTQLLGQAKEETYRDILNSPYLKRIFQLRNAGRSLNALKGIKSNSIVTFNPHMASSNEVLEIRSILNVTFDNFLLGIGGYLKVGDIVGDTASSSLLKAKGQRFGHALEGTSAFVQMQQIHDIPDLGEAFGKGLITPGQLVDIRESKECVEMRTWFEKGCPHENAKDIIRKYVEIIEDPGGIDNVVSKVLRYATTTGITGIEPIAGAIASFVDSIFLSKWLSGPSPRLFMTRAKILQDRHSPIPKPKNGGRAKVRRKRKT